MCFSCFISPIVDTTVCFNLQGWHAQGVTSGTSSSGLSTTQVITWANGAFLFFLKKTKQKQKKKTKKTKNMLEQFKYDHLGSKMLYQDDSDPKYDKKGIHQVILK